jgi:hypothetical protein
VDASGRAGINGILDKTLYRVGGALHIQWEELVVNIVWVKIPFERGEVAVAVEVGRDVARPASLK